MSVPRRRPALNMLRTKENSKSKKDKNGYFNDNVENCEPKIYSYFARLSEKMCTRQSRKVIWDMINTLFLTTVAVEPTFVAFL